LPRNADGIVGDDLAPRRISDTGFDPVLKVLIVVLTRRIESKCGLARRVRLDCFAFDDLSLAIIVTALLLLQIIVVPGVIVSWIPVVIEGALIDDYFDRSVTDGSAKVVVGLNVYFYFLAQAK
jgi:hypothetical protein